MKVIFEGSETEIAKIVKENTLRVRRGLLSVAYVTPEAEAEAPEEVTQEEDSKEVSMDDSKEVSVEEKKAPAKGKGKSK